jgi:hypothetical protein
MIKYINETIFNNEEKEHIKNFLKTLSKKTKDEKEYLLEQYCRNRNFNIELINKEFIISNRV